MIRFAVGAVSDVGKRRTLNEDCALVSERVVAVADGMGGHAGGEVASEVAIEALRVAIADPDVPTLADAVVRANAAVWERAEAPELRGMGTTLCALALVVPDDDVDPSDVDPADPDASDPDAPHPNDAAVAGAAEPGPRLALTNVGDSRAYRLVGGSLEQLTEDHSLVEGLVREGRITSEEAAVHPHRNVVTRVLGIAEFVDIDAWELTPEVGDRFLLCSDGLFNEVDANRIAATLRRLADPQEAAHELVSMANQAGGRDNVTVVVADVVDDDGELAAGFGDRVVRSRREVADMAGFTAIVDEAAVVAPGEDAPRSRSLLPRRERRAERTAPRFTLRTAGFLLLFVGVFVVAGLAVAWYGQGGYFVAADEDTGEVAVFEGRPGGFLWFQPSLVESTGVQLTELTPVLQERISSEPQFASFDEAEAYLANVAEQQAAARPTTTTTSTTSTSTTSTTSTTVDAGSSPAAP
ncbi:PP2C family protein-serine/threonine phosphatase [Actinomarinicola tropica]|uniref:PPM-type phosphatase domain-containing protein n=1 Tax=Actinomarinicola tropica TaxID=2789776 RepID=A0A5Q2RNW7_9ACTN|nr:protein phosphatase 2C domain-containing protein [Actinomarinicola tropica]QGG96642.1 hypothetical protein GH723_16915 [Actinomarinicola tropica]